MIIRNTIKDIVWVDIENPNAREVTSIVEEFNLHPIIAEELMKPSLRPKVEEYGDISYLVFHVPTITQSTHGGKQQEIDFVIGRNFLITVHYEAIESLHNFSKVFEVNSILNRTNMGEHAGLLFFYMLKSLYRDMGLELDLISASVKKMEDVIFSGNERAMVQSLSEIAHKVLDFREALRFHKNVLSSYENTSKRIYGDAYGYYATALSGEFYKLWETIENIRETVIELKKTNDSMLAYKTNETIRVLTIVTFITLPITIISGFFVTNVFVENHYNANYIHGASILASVALFFLFKKIKWI